MLRRSIAVFAPLMGILLLACGPQAAAPAGDAGDTGAGAPSLEAPALPGASEAPAAASAPELPPIQPGVYYNGNFAMRVEQASLLNTTNASRQVILHSNITVTYFNTGSEPMAFILVDPWDSMNVVLDNGMRLNAHRAQNDGVTHCGRNALAQCRVANANGYTQLDPGASVSVNYKLINTYAPDNVALPTIPSIQTGNYVINVHVIEGGGDRTVQASLLNTPLRNGVQL